MSRRLRLYSCCDQSAMSLTICSPRRRTKSHTSWCHQPFTSPIAPVPACSSSSVSEPSSNAAASSGARRRTAATSLPQRHKLHVAARSAAREMSAGNWGTQRAFAMIVPAGMTPIAALACSPSAKSAMRGPATNRVPTLGCRAIVQRSRISEVPASISDTGRVDAKGSKVRARRSSYNTTIVMDGHPAVERSSPLPNIRRERLHQRFQITRPVDGGDEHQTILDHDDEVGHTIHHDAGVWRVHDVVVRIHGIHVALGGIAGGVRRPNAFEGAPGADVVPAEVPG